MTPPIRLTSEANDDLAHAATWYEDRREGLGLAFLAAVSRTIDSIAHWPRTGTSIEDVRADLDARRMGVRRFPYYLAYVVRHDHVLVVAVAHERRRPQFWLSRVD